MSIEQKIAAILAESKLEEANPVAMPMSAWCDAD